MKLKIGIVGLPNVGKSTLFNALTRSSQADAQNFPFCTIDPNVGIVAVSDSRLHKLEEIVVPEKVIPSTVEFVDIAGLVAGASKGEGLGNKFLSHIRECHGICHVLRDFENTDVHHVSGNVDAKRDLEIILTELVLADLQSVEKQIERVERKARSGDKEAKAELGLLERVKGVLAEDRLASSMELTDEEQVIFDRFHCITDKKFLIVANLSEADFVSFDENEFRKEIHADPRFPIIPISAQVESELADLSDEEASEFLKELGAERSGLENLIQKSFEVLGLENYFTAGEKEVRSWTIKKGSTAPIAAGEIHTDFEKGFIKADVISYDDYIACGGEQGAKEAGKLRSEGKEYIVQDGDVIHFKFNV